MKKFVISMLFTAAFAQIGYECVVDESWESINMGLSSDAAGCKVNCDENLGYDANKAFRDYCCHAAVTADSITCEFLFSVNVADIRAVATPVEGTTFSAWAWTRGEAMDDLTLPEEEEEEEEDEEEDDEDMSVRMTLSALATASIAMLAM